MPANTYDAEELKRWVGEIERHENQLESYKGEHMQRCRTVRGHISDVYDRAAEAGIPKRMLKARMKAAALEKKAKAVRESLDDEERDDYDLIRETLGDFANSPLGAAAVDKAEKKRASAAAINALAGDDMAAENAKNLKGGIKQLQ